MRSDATTEKTAAAAETQPVAQSRHYVVNRAPLKPSAYVHLPLGAIKPRGWLKDQLQAQADGLTGYIFSAAPMWAGNGNAPYYHEGVVALAYTLRDERMLALAKRIVDHRLAFKPELFLKLDDPVDYQDYSFLTFPGASIMRYMIEYQEAAGDERIIPWMLKCYREFGDIAKQPPERHDWEVKGRAEHLIPLYWLYNRTGERFLLDTAAQLQNEIARIAESFHEFPKRMPTDHGVILGWMTKYPGFWYLQAHDETHRRASFEAIDRLEWHFGQAGGRFAAHERLPPLPIGREPSCGSELCNVVESAYAMERLFELFGDTGLADRLELLLYNSVPGAMTPDFWAHQYQTQANQVLVSHIQRHFDDGPIANIYGLTHQVSCCLCNMHQPWPRLVENLWMATHDNGVIAVAYGPCETTAKVGEEGAPVVITEETDYPFDGKVRFTLKLDKPVEFPIRLRIPAWAAGATVTVGGERLGPKAGDIAVLKRTWQSGDVVELNLPMAVRTETRCRNAVSILRGPLYFALRIGQEYRELTTAGIARSEVRAQSGFPVFDWEIHPTTPWNYGLIVDREQPEKTVRVETHPVGRLPFAQKGEPFIRKAAAGEKADWAPGFKDWGEGETKTAAFVKAVWQQDEPVVLKVKGRRVLNWGMEKGSAASLPDTYQEADEPEADLELIPYGCTRLRVTEFPALGAAGPQRH